MFFIDNMTSIKMDELLVTWVSSDGVYESILNMVEEEKRKNRIASSLQQSTSMTEQQVSQHTALSDSPPPPPPCIDPVTGSPEKQGKSKGSANILPPKSPRTNTPNNDDDNGGAYDISTHGNGKMGDCVITIPPLLPPSKRGNVQANSANNTTPNGVDRSWAHIYRHSVTLHKVLTSIQPSSTAQIPGIEKRIDPASTKLLSMSEFLEITKDVCRFPSFFNAPLYRRIVSSFGEGEVKPVSSDPKASKGKDKGISLAMIEKFWTLEMEPYDDQERFFRLVKKPGKDCISRDDFLPFIEELLATHPGLEFLSNHAEFQEKYAVTVITRIFYSVQRHGGHNGKITLRQIRKSNLLEAMHLVDTEEDINKVTQYFSYEHFYVLYCRFWELDHDRDYLITREDLLKYGDHSLSHLIVDRIFDAAPRPFESSSIANAAANPATGAAGEGGTTKTGTAASSMRSKGGPFNREYLSYEDFIFFMLSEEDKANEISVRYWFTCIDVDGDGMLNNMEMRYFYGVQLQRMQCLGHEIVPFEDMLCQMMDMIKPKNPEYLQVEDFLQPECSQVSGALFDALFNLNKYLQFEQRDPFMERQKREDEFECDWDRFACIDYNRLAMEEEARDEEAMEIDWVTVDEDDDDADDFNSLGLGGTSEAPF